MFKYQSPPYAPGLDLAGSFEVYVLKGFLPLPTFPFDLAQSMRPQRLTSQFGTDFEVFMRKIGAIIFRNDQLNDPKKFVIRDGLAERVGSGGMEMKLQFHYAVGQHGRKLGCTHTVPKIVFSLEDYREMLEHMAKVENDPDGQFVVVWQPGKAPKDKITIEKAAQWNRVENHQLRERKRCLLASRAKVVIGGKELWIPERVVGIHDDADTDRMARVRWVDAEEETAEFLADVETSFPDILDAFYEDFGEAPNRTGSIGNRRARIFGDILEAEQQNQFCLEKKLAKLEREKKEGRDLLKQLDDDLKDAEEWARERRVIVDMLDLIEEQVDLHEEEVEKARRCTAVSRIRFQKWESRVKQELKQAGRQVWKEKFDSGAVKILANETPRSEELQIETQDQQMIGKGGYRQPGASKKQARFSRICSEWESHNRLLGASVTAAEAWRYARRGGYVNYAENGNVGDRRDFRVTRQGGYDMSSQIKNTKTKAGESERQLRRGRRVDVIEVYGENTDERFTEPSKESRRVGRINYIEISDDEDSVSETEDNEGVLGAR